jgi:hypothetical protein
MSQVDQHGVAKMNLILEQVCEGLSACGGDCRDREYVALEMVEAVRSGNAKIFDPEGERKVLSESTPRKSHVGAAPNAGRPSVLQVPANP